MLKRLSHIFVLTSVLASSLLFNISPARAATTYTVNDLGIINDGVCDSSCTLGDALGLANSNAGADVIDITVNGTISTSAHFLISDSVQINGPGKDNLTIDGGGAVVKDRIFLIQGAAVVTINDVTLTNADMSTYGGTDGGAIRVDDGDLTLNNVAITNSKAGYGGGAIVVDSGESLTATNTIFDGNSAKQGGALSVESDASLSLTDTTISNNTANYASFNSGYGGGLYINGSASPASQMTLDRVFIYNNHAIGTSSGYGGGIYLGDYANLKITNSTISTNDAAQYGGGIYTGAAGGSSIPLNIVIVNTTITGNSLTDTATTRVGAGGFLTSNASLNNVTVIDNNATLDVINNSYGGGITFDSQLSTRTMTVKNSIIANNISDGGQVCGASASDPYTTVKNNLFEEEEGCGATNGVNGNIVGLDPILDPIQQDAIYPTVYIYPLTATSPALNKGDDATCEATDARGRTRPQGVHCDIGAYEAPVIVTFRSVGLNDGWILESTETSGVGGTLNSTATTFNLGDGTLNRQYRGLLHFDTSSLPDNALIVCTTINIKKQGILGTDPFTILGSLKASMRKPSFGTTALELNDFKSAAGKSNVAAFSSSLLPNWYSAELTPTGNLYVNRTGTTQFRLSFTTDDNNDNNNDFMKFFSGNAPMGNRPQLVIYYYTP